MNDQQIGQCPKPPCAPSVTSRAEDLVAQLTSLRSRLMQIAERLRPEAGTATEKTQPTNGPIPELLIEAQHLVENCQNRLVGIEEILF